MVARICKAVIHLDLTRQRSHYNPRQEGREGRRKGKRRREKRNKDREIKERSGETCNQVPFPGQRDCSSITLLPGTGL